MKLYPVYCCGAYITRIIAKASARCPKCGKWARPDLSRGEEDDDGKAQDARRSEG